VRYVLLAIVAWILLSVVVFFVSATLQEGVSPRTERVLGLGGPRTNLLFGSNVLVLGSDARPANSKEPGAGGPARADSILLLHAGFGSVRRLSILRDHVVEVSFENFPKLIDGLGGVNVTLRRCLRSQPFGGRKFSLGRGEHRLNGRQALAFARVRKNTCAPNENDAARAARQQQVLSSMRSRLLNPLTFPRLPIVAWQAPRALRSDMRGPGLAALFTDLVTGGSGTTHVLRPAANGPAGSLLVSELEKRQAVKALQGN